MKKINTSIQYSLFTIMCLFIICSLSISCKNKNYDISKIKHKVENIGHKVNLLVSANDSLFLVYYNENNRMDSIFIYKSPEFIYLKNYREQEGFGVKLKIRECNKTDKVNDLLITYECPENSKLQEVSIFSNFILGISHDGLGSNQYLIIKFKNGHILKIKVIDKDEIANIEDIVCHRNSIYIIIQRTVSLDDSFKSIYRNTLVEINVDDLDSPASADMLF